MICSICKENRHKYLFIVHGFPVRRCEACGLISNYPHPTAEELSAFYQDKRTDPYFAALPDDKTETEAAINYLKILKKRAPFAKHILVVAQPNHCFTKAAKNDGLSVMEVTITDLEKENFISDPVDAVIFLHQLEKSCHIQRAVNKAYSLLKPEGTLLVLTPSTDSFSARFFRNAWTEWRPENHFYFNNITIQLLLWRNGFGKLEIQKDFRNYTLSHISERAGDFPETWVTKTISYAYRILPPFLRGKRVPLPSSAVMVSAKKEVRLKRPLLSIIVPVFNEEQTFPILMDQLLAKKIEGIDKEIVIVESNSKDNSRQLALNYQNARGVRVILQEKARGKGNAVREGFAQAKGDIVLIQDADLEYDMNDYEALIHPVVSYKTAFVLGARHGGIWKIRQLNDQKFLSTFLNFGHLLFSSLLNVLYGQRMKDPFTMYKVFRRDCLHNLKFECNRFDFDYELVIKLLRKGYQPVEIPVNYRSRSFKEGKKVNMFRDPLTWIRASFKYRFSEIYMDK